MGGNLHDLLHPVEDRGNDLRLDEEKEEVRLVLDRTEYSEHTTLGDLYVNGTWEAVSLEDRVRPYKLPDITAIPPGLYDCRVTWSPRFKRHLPLLIDVPGYEGIRIHPGNTHKDSSGCILVGENFQIVSGLPYLLHSVRAFDRLFAKLEAAKARNESISLEVLA
jgi:hypothetical protein